MFWPIVVVLAGRGVEIDTSQPKTWPFELQDNGRGSEIAQWDVLALGPVPTDQELASVTPEQEALARDAHVMTRFTGISRQKDVLATCAVIVRGRDAAAWGAMTIQQKVAAVLAEADRWRDMRAWVEKHL